MDYSYSVQNFSVKNPHLNYIYLPVFISTIYVFHTAYITEDLASPIHKTQHP